MQIRVMARASSIVTAAILLSVGGCYDTLDEGPVACRVGKAENCPVGRECRATAGDEFGRCCKPDDPACGSVDASTTRDVPSPGVDASDLASWYDGRDTSEVRLEAGPVDVTGIDTPTDAPRADADRDAPLGGPDGGGGVFVDGGATGGAAGTGGGGSSAMDGGGAGGNTTGMGGAGGSATVVDAPGGGGSTGPTATGGVVGTGGLVGTGGVVSTGGVSGTGGVVVSSGGVQGSGGAQTGGAQGSGGAQGTGGTQGTGGVQGTGGTQGTGGVQGTGGTQGTGGVQGTGGAGATAVVVVSNQSGGYWKPLTATEVPAGTADVTVDDALTYQRWDGFGGTFHELGWSYLTTLGLQSQATTLLFSATDGANFAWGRIPMGASDYAISRYTCDDTGTDLTPDTSEANRPAADPALSNFSLGRDAQKLIPYIKAAQQVKPALRFWASPWTPPVWMKTSYKKDAAGSGTAQVPSYFDGGNMKSDASLLAAYAQYFAKFVQGYQEQAINIELVAPQQEPGYDSNFPSCLWDKTTFTTFVGQYLGPAMSSLGVNVMLGTLANGGDGGRTDLDIATTVLADSTAKSFVTVVGAQWGILDKVNGGTRFAGLPIWATEHKCGNYPWVSSSYNSTRAPNDQAYGVESWGNIRDAIKKGGVMAYDVPNLVLDKIGQGIDTSRDWKQNALLVVDSGQITPTPAYYVFRHISQYVLPGATVVGTSSSDAIAFKNPDGSLVAVLFATIGKPAYTVKIGGKLIQFAMPASGWATVKYTP